MGNLLQWANISGDSAMVMLTAAEPVMVYRVLDPMGQSIGDVVQPRSRPVLAPGAGTVLLVRGESPGVTRRPRPFAGLREVPSADRRL